MGKLSNILSIIAKFGIPLSIVFLFASVVINSKIQQYSRANTQITDIYTSPTTPIFGQPFDCIITVTADDPQISCGLLKAADPDNWSPGDICPKNQSLGLGYQRTEGNKRIYRCLVANDPNVIEEGQYKIVGRKFGCDGACGDNLMLKPLTIVRNNSIGIPSSTPVSNSPTSMPSISPSVTPSQTPVPTTIPTIRSPVISVSPSPVVSTSPTVFFVGYSATPTHAIPSVYENQQNDKPSPTPGRYDGGVPHFSIDLKPVVVKAGEMGKIISSSAKSGYAISLTILRNIWENYLLETSF